MFNKKKLWCSFYKTNETKLANMYVLCLDLKLKKVLPTLYNTDILLQKL